MAYSINNPLRSLMVDVVTARLSGTGGTAGSQGMLRIYSGAPPADANTPPTVANVLLVEINGIAWTAGSNGTATAVTSYSGTAGTNGLASWGRLSGTNGTGFVIDGSCGTGVAAAFIINSTTIATSSVVTLSTATIIQPG